MLREGVIILKNTRDIGVFYIVFFDKTDIVIVYRVIFKK